MVRTIGLTPATTGLILALMSTGGVLGALIAIRVAKRFGTARAILICGLGAAPFALLIPLAAPGPRLALAVLGGVVIGTGVVAGNVIKDSFRQTYTPRHLLGRVITGAQLLNYGTIPLGALLGGALGTALGLRPTIWIMASALVASTGLLLTGPLKRERNLPEKQRASRRTGKGAGAAGGRECQDRRMNQEQRARIGDGRGFLAALDQSGGSTPKALAAYGVPESAYSTEDEMFGLMHEFRARMMRAPAFDGSRVLGAILFEQTMDRDVAGVAAPQYLWQRKQVVPFVKVDEGLAAEKDGVQLMKPFTKLDSLLARANERNVFGTKMRSFITRADPAGIAAVLDQQFEYAGQILDAGLMPIIEPEVDIHSEDKQAAEELLRQGILDRLPAGRQVMLKVSVPAQDDFYAGLIGHPSVLRVVALSGGYSQQEADKRLARNHGLIASFSRALTEDLHHDQSDEDFNKTLETAVENIYQASTT